MKDNPQLKNLEYGNSFSFSFLYVQVIVIPLHFSMAMYLRTTNENKELQEIFGRMSFNAQFETSQKANWT